MDWIAILWSGFVATTLSTAFFWLARSLGLTSFSPTVQLGCIFHPHPRHPLTETIGFGVLFLVGSTVLAFLFAWILAALGEPTWQRGALLGGLQGVAMAGALPISGTISACIRSGAMSPPGAFGFGWGRATPAVLIAGSALYGAILAALLAAF
jgi:hypothetical protein